MKGKRDGFETTMFSVVVSDTAAVELAIAMDTIVTKSQALAEARLHDMQMRINRRDANSSAIVVARNWRRIEASRWMSRSLLTDVSAQGTRLPERGVPLHQRCCAAHAAGEDIAADDVAMVEVYNYRGGANYVINSCSGTTAMPGAGPVREVFGPRGSQLRSVRPPNPTAVAYVHIWLK